MQNINCSRSNRRFKRHLIGFVLAYFAAFQVFSQATPSAQKVLVKPEFYANKEGNLLWDKSSGTVWMRCAVGMKWNGQTCAGVSFSASNSAMRAYVEKLNQAGGDSSYTDWELPDIWQLASTRLCTKGLAYLFDPEDNSPDLPRECKQGSVEPTVDSIAFPKTSKDLYHSRTSHPIARSQHGGVSFGSGEIAYYFPIINGEARLVRKVRMTAAQASDTFTEKLPQ